MGASPALPNGFAVAALLMPAKFPLAQFVCAGIAIRPTRPTKVSVVPDRSPRRKACFSLTQGPLRQAPGAAAPASANSLPQLFTRFWRTVPAQFTRAGL